VGEEYSFTRNTSSNLSTYSIYFKTSNDFNKILVYLLITFVLYKYWNTLPEDDPAKDRKMSEWQCLHLSVFSWIPSITGRTWILKKLSPIW
jgi:hypothetical protein